MLSYTSYTNKNKENHNDTTSTRVCESTCWNKIIWNLTPKILPNIYKLTVRRANFWLFPLNAKLSNVYGMVDKLGPKTVSDTSLCLVQSPRHGYHICSRTDLHRPSLSHRQLEVQHPLAPYSWDRWSSSSASRRCTPRGRCACRVGSALHPPQWTLSCRSHTLCSFYSHRKCQLVGAVLIQFSGLFWPVLLLLVDLLGGTHLGTDNILELR